MIIGIMVKISREYSLSKRAKDKLEYSWKSLAGT
jgi:hypothetical protein